LDVYIVFRVSFYFFSHCTREHRDLHSFPTRRSSDLPAQRVQEAAAALSSGDAEKALVLATGALAATNDPSASAAAQHIVIEAHLDRKSTRLNSSHEWISYAVFCLKKKNKITQEQCDA